MVDAKKVLEGLRAGAANKLAHSMDREIFSAAIALIESQAAEIVEVEEDWDEIDGFMNRIDATISESLEKIGEFPGKPAGFPDRVDVACRLIESIPVLKAEIERLTPKGPELARAIETLNKHRFKCGDGGGEWTLVQRDDGLAASDGEIIMYTRTAVLTAEGLEAAEKEAAK